MQKEIWKDIEGWEGYQVSNSGRVKSLDRFVSNSRYGKQKIKGVNIKPSKTRTGYVMMAMSASNNSTHKSIHRLVAMSFIPNPKNKKQVNHINGIKTDNRVENLEWCTPSENVKHAYRTGLNKPNIGSKNGNSKPVLQFDLKGNFINEYDTARAASKETSVFWGSISDVCRNAAKTAGGFIWKFKK